VLLCSFVGLPASSALPHPRSDNGKALVQVAGDELVPRSGKLNAAQWDDAAKVSAQGYNYGEVRASQAYEIANANRAFRNTGCQLTEQISYIEWSSTCRSPRDAKYDFSPTFRNNVGGTTRYRDVIKMASEQCLRSRDCTGIWDRVGFPEIYVCKTPLGPPIQRPNRNVPQAWYKTCPPPAPSPPRHSHYPAAFRLTGGKFRQCNAQNGCCDTQCVNPNGQCNDPNGDSCYGNACSRTKNPDGSSHGFMPGCYGCSCSDKKG